jgi:DNA processing protein
VTERLYWLGFSLVPDIGPKRLHALHAHFGDLGRAWHASEGALARSGLEPAPLASLLRVRARLDLHGEMDRVRRAGVQLLTRPDPTYPGLLGRLADAPPVLYVKGDLTDADARALAIVGTRKATVYGRDTAGQLSRQLAEQGFTIVSGLAHGIDAAAHRAAIEAGGRTLAVMGTGVDVVYPRDHARLADEISRHGALVSEFPLGTRPDRRNFPRRNRLISGLSLGVLVAEAPEQSGALITAATAAEQGREVFAVPGSIFSPNSAGCHRLIQDGAKLVQSVEDVLEELNVAYQAIETRATTERIAPGSATEAQVLGYLSREPIHVDLLARASGLPVATVSSTLTLLELKGLARLVGPMQYSLPL